MRAQCARNPLVFMEVALLARSSCHRPAALGCRCRGIGGERRAHVARGRSPAAGTTCTHATPEREGARGLVFAYGTGPQETPHQCPAGPCLFPLAQASSKHLSCSISPSRRSRCRAQRAPDLFTCAHQLCHRRAISTQPRGQISRTLATCSPPVQFIRLRRQRHQLRAHMPSDRSLYKSAIASSSLDRSRAVSVVTAGGVACRAASYYSVSRELSSE